MLIEKLKKYKISLAVFSLIIVLLPICFRFLVPSGEVFCVVFLDVGQGDCIFLKTPSGHTILVDGGGETKRSESTLGRWTLEPFLRHEGINTIDIVILTHPHEDHVQGLLPVLDDFKVRMVLEPGIPHGSKSYREFLSKVENRHIQYRRATRGQVIDFGDGVKAQILNPTSCRLYGTSDDFNNNSVVLRFSYGKSSLLLTGDAGIEAEESILSSNIRVKSDILKIGHHGSRSATSEAWLDAVSPKYAVISVGKHNSFGHPSTQVLSTISDKNIVLYRTDINGAITFRLTRNGIQE